MDKSNRSKKRLERTCNLSFMAKLGATNRQLGEIRRAENEASKLRREQAEARALFQARNEFSSTMGSTSLGFRSTNVTLPPIGRGRRARSSAAMHGRSDDSQHKRLAMQWQPHKGDDETDADVVQKMKDTCSGTRSLRVRVAASMAQQEDTTEVLIKKVARKTGLSQRKVEDLHRVFTRGNKKAKSLVPSAFVKVMSEFGIEDSQILERLYTIFDAGCDKSMSFEEFVDCMAVFLLGDRDRQAQVLFKMMDTTGDGVVSKLELLRFFAGGEHDREKKRLLGALVSELMNLIDEDASGEVTYEEWVSKITNDESVWEIFSAISPLTDFVESVKKAGKYILPY